MWLRPNSSCLLATLVWWTIAGFSTFTQPAGAAPEAVSIGDVKISVDAGVDGSAAVELGRAVRAVLKDELKQVTGFGNPKRPLIVSATVTRVSSERLADASKASASISLALLRADDRVLFAELRGRASVEEPSGTLVALRSVALRRAAQRAMSRLPEAIHRCD